MGGCGEGDNRSFNARTTVQSIRDVKWLLADIWDKLLSRDADDSDGCQKHCQAVCFITLAS